jgi:hypothetical protein
MLNHFFVLDIQPASDKQWPYDSERPLLANAPLFSLQARQTISITRHSLPGTRVIILFHTVFNQYND